MRPVKHLNRTATAAAFMLLGASLLPHAQAAVVYKCAANGIISYSQLACTGAEVLNVDDSRTDHQKAEADALTRRTQEMASTLQWKRYASEIPVQRVAPPAPVLVPVYIEQEPRHIVRRVVVSRPVGVQRHR